MNVDLINGGKNRLVMKDMESPKKAGEYVKKIISGESDRWRFLRGLDPSECTLRVLHLEADYYDLDGNRLQLGKWQLFEDCANSGVYCSVCHKKVYKECYANQKVFSKYCPNCGHMMDTKNIQRF